MKNHSPLTKGFIKGLKKVIQTWEFKLFLLFLFVFGVNTLLSPYFLDFYNLIDSTNNFIEQALIVLPMTLIIICRDIDLSVASIIALSSLCMGLVHSMGAGATTIILTGLSTGAVAGFFNGWLITRFALPSIVVTIGTMSLFRGIAHLSLGDQAFTNYPESFTTLGQNYLFDLIPLELLVFLLLLVVFIVFLHHTKFGRRIYAIGNNPESAWFSGIAVNRYRWFLFTLIGVISALSSIFLTARIGSTRPNIAMGWELEIITMVVLGGVNIMGGSGTIWGVFLSIFVWGMVSFGFSLHNVPGIVSSIFLGSLLILSIALPRALEFFLSKNKKAS